MFYRDLKILSFRYVTNVTQGFIYDIYHAYPLKALVILTYKQFIT